MKRTADKVARYYNVILAMMVLDVIHTLVITMEVFGITVWDMDESAWQYFWYTKCSGRYFLSYNLTLYFEDFQAIGFRTMDNGNTEVYYSGDFPAKFGVVTVKPVGNSYQIVSNKWLA